MPGYLKILFLQLFLISQVSAGQTIVRSSLCSMGSSVSREGLILRQTVGQSSSTYVFNKEGLVLRQGFQQSVKSINPSEAIVPVDFTLSPNPANDKTLLKFHQEIGRSIISVRDIKGNLLSELKVESLTAIWLDLKNYKPGLYIITVISGNNKGSRRLIITH
jgi:hypothetical protein